MKDLGEAGAAKGLGLSCRAELFLDCQDWMGFFWPPLALWVLMLISDPSPSCSSIDMEEITEPVLELMWEYALVPWLEAAVPN